MTAKLSTLHLYLTPYKKCPPLWGYFFMESYLGLFSYNIQKATAPIAIICIVGSSSGGGGGEDFPVTLVENLREEVNARICFPFLQKNWFDGEQNRIRFNAK